MQAQSMRISFLLGALVGCGSNAAGSAGDECTVDASYDPKIDPDDFVAVVDNSLMPWLAETRFTYQGEEETIEVVVMARRKSILGVECTVVRDTATVGGEVTEDTFDWYAQDKDGNVWYFGEDTKEYEGGKVTSTKGSWQSGVDGAKPGIVMQAKREIGRQYRQEYYACEAEDMAEVRSVDASVAVPYGKYDGCVKTREFTPLEPSVEEFKYYCEGIGLVLEVDAKSKERTELIRVEAP